MEDIEDRAEQVRISREESPRGDKERITIERTRRVKRVIEQPTGRVGRDGGIERMARGMIGSQESSGLPDMGEEEEQQEEQEETPAKGKGKAKAKGSGGGGGGGERHISIGGGGSKQATQSKPRAPPSTPKKRDIKGVFGTFARRPKGPRRTPKRKRRGGDETTESFALYIGRVLKQVHPDQRISKKGMAVLESLVRDIYGRIAGESKTLVSKAGLMTLDSRTLQTAVKLLFPGELAKHAVSEGTQAVMRFSQAT